MQKHQLKKLRPRLKTTDPAPRLTAQKIKAWPSRRAFFVCGLSASWCATRGASRPHEAPLSVIDPASMSL